MALQWKLDEEHSGWWKATVGDAEAMTIAERHHATNP
jgi:hypothetical protein